MDRKTLLISALFLPFFISPAFSQNKNSVSDKLVVDTVYKSLEHSKQLSNKHNIPLKSISVAAAGGGLSVSYEQIKEGRIQNITKTMGQYEQAIADEMSNVIAKGFSEAGNPPEYIKNTIKSMKTGETRVLYLKYKPNNLQTEAWSDGSFHAYNLEIELTKDAKGKGIETKLIRFSKEILPRNEIGELTIVPPNGDKSSTFLTTEEGEIRINESHMGNSATTRLSSVKSGNVVASETSWKYEYGEWRPTSTNYSAEKAATHLKSLITDFNSVATDVESTLKPSLQVINEKSIGVAKSQTLLETLAKAGKSTGSITKMGGLLGVAIVLVSTGMEVYDIFYDTAKAGNIYNSNGAKVSSLVSQIGNTDPNIIKAQIKQMIETASKTPNHGRNTFVDHVLMDEYVLIRHDEEAKNRT